MIIDSIKKSKNVSALQSFVQSYKEQRDEQRSQYRNNEPIEIDFSKTNGVYQGEDLVKLKDYIYILKTSGYKTRHIAYLVDLTPSTVLHHYNNYRPNFKK